MIRGSDIHDRIRGDWPATLAQLGVPEEYRREKIGNREKHGACPGCAGTDRYFFDNKHPPRRLLLSRLWSRRWIQAVATCARLDVC